MNTMRNPLLAIAAMLAALSMFTLTPAANAQVAADPLLERLQVRADAAEQAVQRLTGRIEELGFQNRQLGRAIEDQNALIEKQAALINKLEARVAELEALANAAVEEAANAANTPREEEFSLVGPTSPATMKALAAERAAPDEALESKGAEIASPTSLTLEETPEGLFKQAKNLLVRGDYPAAETAFGEFLDKFSEDDRAAEAQYWLGESLLIQEAYPEATEAYVSLVSTWPQAEKAPDAFVKLARALRMMGQKAEACEALSQASKLYPNAGPVFRSSVARERDRAECNGA